MRSLRSRVCLRFASALATLASARRLSIRFLKKVLSLVRFVAL